MYDNWVKVGGHWIRQRTQTADEVQKVLDTNEHMRNNSSRPGGVGSENMRFLARVPAIQDARWRQEWMIKGGQKGTGMKANDYCLLKASLPDYSKFVTAPSGKTGLERKARRMSFRK